MDYEEFLSERGYKTGTEGSIFFSVLLEETIVALLKHAPKNEIKTEVITHATDHYYRFFRVSKKDFLGKINKFCASSVDEKEKEKEDEDLEDRLLRLGKKYIKENFKGKENQKCKKR